MGVFRRSWFYFQQMGDSVAAKNNFEDTHEQVTSRSIEFNKINEFVALQLSDCEDYLSDDSSSVLNHSSLLRRNMLIAVISGQKRHRVMKKLDF